EEPKLRRLRELTQSFATFAAMETKPAPQKIGGYDIPITGCAIQLERNCVVALLRRSGGAIYAIGPISLLWLATEWIDVSPPSSRSRQTCRMSCNNALFLGGQYCLPEAPNPRKLRHDLSTHTFIVPPDPACKDQ